jgi:hypothetical protein
MHNIIQFILDYKEYIIGFIVLAVIAFGIGRRKAIKKVGEFLKKEEQSLVEHIEKDPNACAKLVYNTIPLKFRFFVSVGTIEKVITKLTQVLDKK